MADKHPGIEEKINPTDLPINNVPEEQGEGDDPFTGQEDEDEEVNLDSSDDINIAKLSPSQIDNLKRQLSELEVSPAKGRSGISDSESVDAEEAHGERAIAMRDFLRKQPRVTFMIPKRDNEPPNTVETVIMNGWRINILKGEFVDLPKPVVEILKDSYKHTMNDNQPYLISNLGTKVDEITGERKDPSQLL